MSPGDVYQATKARGRVARSRLPPERGLPVTVVRPGAIYGPGETRLLKLFRSIARGRYAIVGSGGASTTQSSSTICPGVSSSPSNGPRPSARALLGGRPQYVSQTELAEPHRPSHRRSSPPVSHSRMAHSACRAPRRGRLRSAWNRASDPPTSDGVLDEEPGLQHREGSAPSGLRTRRWTSTKEYDGPPCGTGSTRGSERRRARRRPRCRLVGPAASHWCPRIPSRGREGTPGRTARPIWAWPGVWLSTAISATKRATRSSSSGSTPRVRRACS